MFMTGTCEVWIRSSFLFGKKYIVQSKRMCTIKSVNSILPRNIDIISVVTLKMVMVLHPVNQAIITEFVIMIGTVCWFTINTSGDIRKCLSGATYLTIDSFQWAVTMVKYKEDFIIISSNVSLISPLIST